MTVQVAPGQATEVEFTIEVGSYQVNQITGEASQLWNLPSMPGVPQVNLVDPDHAATETREEKAAPGTARIGREVGYPYTGYVPRYRGDNLRR